MANLNLGKDDEMYIKQSDIDAIQHRPSMYISSVGMGGVLQLCKELSDNSRDECGKKDSPGDKIYIEITDKSFLVKDNGRGIPTDLLRVIYETNQAGSNMLRAGGETIGENGSGTALCTAFAHKLVVTSIRPQEKKKLTIEYNEGKLVSEKCEPYTGTEHGLINYFEPSKFYLGADKIPVDELVEWLRGFDYTVKDEYKIMYNVRGKDYKVQSKPLHQFIREYINDPKSFATQHLEVSCKGKLDEVFMEKTYHRTFEIDAVFMYSNPEYKGEIVHQSWMNKINTIQHGSHFDGVVAGFQRFITEKCIKRNKKLEDEDLRRDIMNHLNIVVNAKCNLAHMFSGQTKYNCIAPDLGKAIADAIYEALCKSNAKNVIDDCVEMVLGNHRARVAGEASRSINKAIKNDGKWVIPDNFIPASNVKCDIPRELYKVEGNSAGGGLRKARDARYQAIYMSRGKSLSTWGKSIGEVLKSKVWADFIKILGCGIGPTFNLKKLKYDKIIICTDADIDGFQIRTLDVAIFVMFFPEIIKDGRLYIAEPPLYRLWDANRKKYFYVATQNEYIDVCINSIGDIELKFPERKNLTVTPSAFVHDTFEYLPTLREVATSFAVNPQLLEYIAWGFANNDSDPKKFIKNIDKWLRKLTGIYKEIGFNNKTNQITAVIDYCDQIVVIDENLLEALRPIIDVINAYGVFIEYTYRKLNVNRANTISAFYTDIEKYYPTIKDRYKGLGSSPAQISKEVIMDPKTRRLIRLTMDDAKIMVQMNTLLAKDKESMAARKTLIAGYEFTKNDIDN